MTGPEHYREAERLLALDEDPRDEIARAHVHALLAQAAATALPPLQTWMPESVLGEELEAWLGALAPAAAPAA